MKKRLLASAPQHFPMLVTQPEFFYQTITQILPGSNLIVY